MDSPSTHLQPAHARFARRGSLIIEAVISVALLATATYALARLAQSSAELSQQADQRLAATLTAENVLERLGDLPADQIATQASEIAKTAAEVSHCDVEIKSESFSSNDSRGVHIRVDVMPASNVRVTLHDWRLESSSDATALVVRNSQEFGFTQISRTALAAVFSREPGLAPKRLILKTDCDKPLAAGAKGAVTTATALQDVSVPSGGDDA